ncbi:WD40 repeat-like protein [Paxillus ammoniavirescens]|nr:WD40 repeat-like protein [Paxillus ammoniavirescens]
MHTSSRSVFPEIASVPPVASSDSSHLASSKNANHQVPVQVLEGHENMVLCICFRAENKVVSGSVDHTLRIWDQKTGATQVLMGHTDTVWDVDVSQDGKMVVSGSADYTVGIWDGESGEMMQVCWGHRDEVYSVKFSPDSSRIVSGSNDCTVRVWSVETGDLAFEPIECHGTVNCVCYSPGGDKFASCADTVQIWNAETGVGILSFRNSKVWSLAWTVDSTHIIGGRKGEVTIWNSDDGDQLRTWKAHDDWIAGLSLSPTAPTHLATCSWYGKTAFIFDISTGMQVAALEHDQNLEATAFSPSGRYIVTACHDRKLYLWEAPAFGNPKTKPFLSLLDRPAIPPAGSSRNDTRGLDPFWDSLPTRAREASPLPKIAFNGVRNTFAKFFIRRPAVAAQTFWIVLERITWTPVKKMIFMLFFCRQPGPQERGGFAPIHRHTRANSSRTQAGNAAATKNQSGHPKTGRGAKIAGAGPVSSPPIANNPVIDSQPERTAAMRLSGEGPGSDPRSSATPRGNSQIRNQPESIETVAISGPSTVPAHASPQPTPSSEPLSLAVISCEPSSSAAVVVSAPLFMLSKSARPASARTASHNVDVSSAITLSPIEIAMIEEYRRRQATSSFVETTAKPLKGSGHDHGSDIYPHPSTSLPRSPVSVTRNTSPAQRPSSP